jgi:matrixin
MIARAAAAIALALALPVAARASTIMELSPAELADGADRIVEGTVVARDTRWDTAHTGLETHATIAVDAAAKGGDVATVEIVVPGGELDGMRHVIVGMPAVSIGDRARWFLRDRGDGTLRVYGWAQGKWPARTIAGVEVFAPAPIEAEHLTTATAFTTNGMRWPASKMPVPYLIQNAGSPDLPIAQVIAAVDAAFATWQAVPTASLTFRNAGMTDLPMAIDGSNIILFIESNWTFGSEAAAATSLFIIDGQQTADIAMNGQTFTWAVAPPSSAINAKTLDLQAVLTHEIGHFSGLDHTQRSIDTMYFSWKPWQGQRTLSIDDKLGLSSIYPVRGDECPSTRCTNGETCRLTAYGHLCGADPDPIGTPCNYDRVECDAFCLFTSADLSTGYCSRFCESNADCPATHHCDVASAGGTPVKVCFAGAQPRCAGDAQCPAGQHCDIPSGTCTFECRTSDDCGPDTACDERGSCVAVPGGGGCAASGGRGAASAALAGVLALGLATRRKRRLARR